MCQIDGQEASVGGWCKSQSQREGEKERETEKALWREGGGVLWLFCQICNLCLMLPGCPGDFLMWKRSTEYIRMICMIRFKIALRRLHERTLLNKNMN